MFDHVSIGVADLDRARRFYDAALAPLGYRCLRRTASELGYGDDAVHLWVGMAERPVPPDLKSNLHFCFAAPTRQSVEAFHRAALQAGGSDNGGPGIREAYEPTYYAAFVIDPEGYRIEAYQGGPQR